MAGIYSMGRFVVFLVWIIFENAVLVHGEKCGQPGNEQYCEHGCCISGSNEVCCTISTSVLVVACVVSGLVLVAMVTSIVICCYKNYKDKQANRVRRLQQEQANNAPRVRGVEPRKPPDYISAPPEYSVEMPESHYRPQTVTGHVSYNQRFRGTTPATPRGTISTTRTSGRHPVNNSLSFRSSHIPGAVPIEAPPPYTEYARGQTPANRRQRFITTTPQVETNNSNTQNTEATITRPLGTNETLLNTATTSTVRVRHQNNLHTQPIQESNTPLSSITDSSDSSSRAISTRAQESRGESRADLQSRSQTIARVLGSSRTPRAPTRSRGTDMTNQINTSFSDAHENESSANMESSTPGTNSQPSDRNNSMMEDLTIV